MVCGPASVPPRAYLTSGASTAVLATPRTDHRLGDRSSSRRPAQASATATPPATATLYNSSRRPFLSPTRARQARPTPRRDGCSATPRWTADRRRSSSPGCPSPRLRDRTGPHRPATNTNSARSCSSRCTRSSACGSERSASARASPSPSPPVPSNGKRIYLQPVQQGVE